MKTIGPGYTEINTSDGKGHPIYPVEDYVKIRQNIHNEISSKRGEFIAKCGDVDFTLGEAISWFFFEQDKNNKEIFSELILHTEFFSFAQKKKVLESLIKNHPKKYVTFNADQKKEFFEHLMKIIRCRNILAHGELIIDMKNQKAQMSYYDASRLQNSIVDTNLEFFNELQKHIGFVIKFCFNHLIYPE